MNCRPHCGACCIAPSIVHPFFGMPHGKAAGERCVHLNGELACQLFSDSRRPLACGTFAAELAVCGVDRAQALVLIAAMEEVSRPAI